jgi:hypothetical protein
MTVISVGSLIDGIAEYIGQRNRNPQAITWMASIRSILRKVAAKKAFASRH